MLSYEWNFLSPKGHFDLFLQVLGRVEERGFVYLAEALAPDGTIDPNVTFDWYYSDSLQRWFLYSPPATTRTTSQLRSLTSDRQLLGLRLTVRPWGSPDPFSAHGECWLRTSEAGVQAKSGIWALSRGLRATTEDLL